MEVERRSAIKIFEIAGKDYSEFVRWVYQINEEIIEEKCGKCKKDCPYVSIEGILRCVLGNLDYSKLYERFKEENAN